MERYNLDELFDANIDFEPLRETLKSIYRNLFTTLSPDISGYYLVFFNPPDLSGLPNYTDYLIESGIREWLTIVATNVTLPEHQLDIDQTSSSAHAIPFATQYNATTQFSIAYAEPQDIKLYEFHMIWLEYIHMLLQGLVEPAARYTDPLSDDYGAVDYMASFYIVRFNPAGKLNYLGRLAGVFPINKPVADIIGDRGTIQLTRITVNYTVAHYTEATPTTMQYFPEHKHVYTEIKHILQTYGISIGGQ